MITTILGTVAIVGAMIVLGIVIDRRISLFPRPEELADAERPKLSAHAAGEAPATAIRAGSALQIERLRASQRCPACRAAMQPEADDRVRYDTRELIVLHFRCPACATKRVLYVEPAA